MCAATSRLLSLSCEVVGVAADTATLLEAARRLRPDVVLLDLSLVGAVNALDACRRIKETLPPVNVVAFTVDDDPGVRAAAEDAGASGFVWKFRASRDLARVIQMVADGAAGPAADNVS